MSILAIDPGTNESAYVVFADGTIVESDIVDNLEMENILASQSLPVACEWVESMGMAVGKEVFETVYWIGRFHAHSREFQRVTRRSVKMHLCQSMRAKDANIRQRLLDMFPATGGGKTPQVGTKSNPGPLYGVRSHIWSALAVAITALELDERTTNPKGE